MSDRYSKDYERSAAGLDFDEPIREKAAALGSQLAAEGPGPLLDEIENLLPDEWRQHISTFPLAAITLGFGVGMFLGMKKRDMVLAAVTSLVTAAATQNVNQVLGKTR